MPELMQLHIWKQRMVQVFLQHLQQPVGNVQFLLTSQKNLLQNIVLLFLLNNISVQYNLKYHMLQVYLFHIESLIVQ